MAKKAKELTFEEIDGKVLLKMVELLNEADLDIDTIKTKKRDTEEIFDDFLDAIGDVPEDKVKKIPPKALDFYNKIVTGDRGEEEPEEKENKKDKKKDKDEDDEKSSKKGKKEAEPEEITTADELKEMSEKEMKKLIKNNDIDVDPDDCDDEDELRAAIAKELGLDMKAKKDKKGKEKEKEVEPEDGITADELKDMSEKEMKKLIKSEKLDVDPDDCDDEDELRAAIAKELDIDLKGKKDKKDKKKDKDEEPEEKAGKKDKKDSGSEENMFGFKEGSFKAVISEMFLDDGCTLKEAAAKAEKKFDKEGMKSFSSVLGIVKKLIKNGCKVEVTISAKPKK